MEELATKEQVFAGINALLFAILCDFSIQVGLSIAGIICAFIGTIFIIYFSVLS